jgi:hypothetical protein
MLLHINQRTVEWATISAASTCLWGCTQIQLHKYGDKQPSYEHRQLARVLIELWGMKDLSCFLGKADKWPLVFGW